MVYLRKHLFLALAVCIAGLPQSAPHSKEQGCPIIFSKAQTAFNSDTHSYDDVKIEWTNTTAETIVGKIREIICNQRSWLATGFRCYHNWNR